MTWYITIATGVVITIIQLSSFRSQYKQIKLLRFTGESISETEEVSFFSWSYHRYKERIMPSGRLPGEKIVGPRDLAIGAASGGAGVAAGVVAAKVVAGATTSIFMVTTAAGVAATGGGIGAAVVVGYLAGYLASKSQKKDEKKTEKKDD